MPITVQQMENLANLTLDYYYKTPKVMAQTLQDKPLLRLVRANKTKFPGGKENISGAVKGEYTTTLQGFEYDDTVGYQNPANAKRWNVPYKLIHWGITFTMHELAQNGISIVDTTTGESESTHSQAEKIQLGNLMKEKVEDMVEGSERGFNEMFWRDGTQDSKLVPGVTYFVVDDPTAATVVAGIDQSTNTWWRNRADLAITLGDTTGASQALVTKLQTEERQLRRYGGRPNVRLCGSDFLDRLEKELRYKGNYTDTGWANKGGLDVAIDDVKFKGTKFEYDPTLDDLGWAKRCYVLDTRRLHCAEMDGEANKSHNPARPENKYVFYRAKTWIGGLICEQRNCHGVYGFA